MLAEGEDHGFGLSAGILGLCRTASLTAAL